MSAETKPVELTADERESLDVMGMFPTSAGFDHPAAWERETEAQLVSTIERIIAAREAERPYNASAWSATLPCPTCGNMTVIGYLLVNERDEHMHTRYVCTFWPSGTVGDDARCGWAGWSVPGWDQEDEEGS